MSVYFEMFLFNVKTKANVLGLHAVFSMMHNLSYLGNKTEGGRNFYQRINLKPKA